jgi:hypothetical protein
MTGILREQRQTSYYPDGAFHLDLLSFRMSKIKELLTHMEYESINHETFANPGKKNSCGNDFHSCFILGAK